MSDRIQIPRNFLFCKNSHLSPSLSRSHTHTLLPVSVSFVVGYVLLSGSILLRIAFIRWHVRWCLLSNTMLCTHRERERQRRGRHIVVYSYRVPPSTSVFVIVLLRNKMFNTKMRYVQLYTFRRRNENTFFFTTNETVFIVKRICSGCRDCCTMYVCCACVATKCKLMSLNAGLDDGTWNNVERLWFDVSVGWTTQRSSWWYFMFHLLRLELCFSQTNCQSSTINFVQFSPHDWAAMRFACFLWICTISHPQQQFMLLPRRCVVEELGIGNGFEQCLGSMRDAIHKIYMKTYSRVCAVCIVCFLYFELLLSSHLSVPFHPLCSVFVYTIHFHMIQRRARQNE